MKHVIKNILIVHIASSIPAVPGISKIGAVFKKLRAVVRFFIPKKRKFYSHKEEQAYRAAINIKKNNPPGPGPPM